MMRASFSTIGLRGQLPIRPPLDRRPVNADSIPAAASPIRVRKKPRPRPSKHPANTDERPDLPTNGKIIILYKSYI